VRSTAVNENKWRFRNRSTVRNQVHSLVPNFRTYSIPSSTKHGPCKVTKALMYEIPDRWTGLSCKQKRT